MEVQYFGGAVLPRNVDDVFPGTFLDGHYVFSQLISLHNDETISCDDVVVDVELFVLSLICLAVKSSSFIRKFTGRIYLIW